MRPLRLLLSLCTTLTAVALFLFLVLGEQNEAEEQHLPGVSPPEQKGKLHALFSFTSPGSLFPPSAIISLTDDNSTFFLARPAAFGPALPHAGLSGALWIGSGFGDESMTKGELGCSDVPGGNGATGQPDIQSLHEGAEIAGKVVLLKRGGCGFLEKVLWAQKRGGVALIVGDDVRGGGLVRMYARGDTSNVTIPSLFTSYTTAHLLSSLLPTDGFFRELSPAHGPKLRPLKGGQGDKSGFSEKPDKNSGKWRQPNATPKDPKSTQTAKTMSGGSSGLGQTSYPPKASWLGSLLPALGVGEGSKTSNGGDSRRPPSSGKLNWASDQNSQMRKAGVKPTIMPNAPSPTPVEFVIGEQDWRDTALLPQPTPDSHPRVDGSNSLNMSKEGRVLPNSGEYVSNSPGSNGWFGKLLRARKRGSPGARAKLDKTVTPSPLHHGSSSGPKAHEGLWVTLTPTNMSTSPFFDTLLVLVVSPLVTLTVVYALLLLRSRIRRRRWRAPKSLVDRLPIRTYHTISDTSPSATPNASSPSTPLLQHSVPRPPSPSPPPQPRSQSDSEMPATSSSYLQPRRTPEEEKHESGLAAWRRRYGGRQRECVVCLEEYEDGVSQVMSLPCGHEFHADCM